MHARPILLVRDPLAEGMVIHNEVKKALSDAGYFVLLAPPEAMDSMKVLAPCPFTEADVDVLRFIAGERFPSNTTDNGLVIRSIADRIAGMLESE